MSIYVDDCRLAFKGRQWCHMVADSLEELHEFALQLGLKPDWFQHKTLYPHYDITLSVRMKAVQLGARTCDKKTVVHRAKALRLQLNEQYKKRNSAILIKEARHDHGERQIQVA